MRKYLLPLLLLPFMVAAQTNTKPGPGTNYPYPELQSMSSYDSLMLSQLPAYQAPPEALRRLIPYAIDNSAYPWFRPLVAQVGLECGQASSIGLVFTYEMAYLRQVPANIPENQYTTHFTYNFINGGSNAGINFYESYEIIKKAGNPTIADYGGMAPGGATMWMTGYNKYYNAMHNRINGVYSIKVNTAEGIQTLKNWIFDHSNGSTAGGVGCFYAEYTNPPVIFPQGVPEAGKHVITAWGNSANHAMTICGYNDSIRWDYNNDGRYTNNIDLNGDGILDVRDWEIGGFKMANTYGSINGWGDQGFAYMMYKSVADQFQQGGIWNNTVVIIDANPDYEPLLTAKISLTHTCRNKLKITAGVASDPAATEPDYILHFPVFDFQGGCNPMQGNGYPDQIEFGLDLNPLLTMVEPGSENKYFLMIQENDPLNGDSGALMSFSLMNYTQGIQEINSQVNELPLVSNGVTKVGVNATINFDRAEITTENLPPLQLYSNYSAQLQANGGTPPYRWQLAEEYVQFDSATVMQNITGLKLTLSNNSNGKALVELPFSFPYFGKSFNEVYATSDGYLIFENTLIPWPFYIEGRTYFIDKPMIAPSMSNPYIINNAEGDGVWYEENDNYVTFRWKMSVYQNTGTVNATVRLYDDGRIEMNFGEFNVPSFVRRYTGISAGDGSNYYLMSHNPDYSPQPDQLIRYTPVQLHPGITLSETGLLSGTAVEMSEAIPLKFRVTDNNNISSYKTLILNTEGLQLDYETNSGDDSVIEFGETFALKLTVTNHNSFALGQTNFSITTIDTRFSIITASSQISGLQPGETVVIDSAFLIKAGNNVPDNHQAPFTINASSAEGNWARNIRLNAFRPVITISSIEIIDGGNGILDPGEMALLRITFFNSGGARLFNASAFVQSWDPYLTLGGLPQIMDTLAQGQSWVTTYSAALAAETPPNHQALVNVNVTGHNQFSFLQTVPLLNGFIVDDFESGNFSSFEWQTGGHASWYVEEGQAWEGNNNARSGVIADNQTSSLWLNWNVAFADSVSFWFRVSSEPSYDFLHFYVGDEEMGKWAGETEWSYRRYPVNAGEQTFAWRYIKDYSVSTGDDCARIDYVMLPVFAVATNPKYETISVSGFSVYPNPFTENITITYKLEEPTTVVLSVADNYGRILWQESQGKKTPGEYTLRPSVNLSSSGYYLFILETNEARYIKKLVRTSH